MHLLIVVLPVMLEVNMALEKFYEELMMSERRHYDWSTHTWWTHRTHQSSFPVHVKSLERYSNPTESREKPKDPVWSPVPQALQSETAIQHTISGLYCFSNWSTCYEHPTCGYSLWNNAVIPHVRHQSSSLSDALVAFPDWALDLRLKVKDEAINLGATIAEYRQSASMFGSAAKGVVDAWRAFKRGKFLKKKTSCDISAAHLVYDYGVAPLLSDMYDSYEALKLRLERPVRKRYFFKQKARPYRETSDLRYNSWITGERITELEMDQFVCAWVQLNLKKASMFTLGNPLEVAWELVPYSFVYDWLIPIGDVLIALDAMKAVDKVKVCVTRKREQVDTYNYTIDDEWHAPRPVEKPGWVRYRDHERLVYDSVPLPSIPKLDFSASINKLLNATSLLHVARGCKGRPPRFSRADFGR